MVLQSQSPRNRVNTSNPVARSRCRSTPASSFNPLEIGSTLQIFRMGGGCVGYGDYAFQSPRNRVNTSNLRTRDLHLNTYHIMFQSPRNRVNTSNGIFLYGVVGRQEEGFNPLEIGSTLQMRSASPSSSSRRLSFNPLEIGSTLQIRVTRCGRVVIYIRKFQSPRNRVNTSNPTHPPTQTHPQTAPVSIP